MSGHKRATITITRDEYERLREAREDFHSIPDIPGQIFDALTQQRNRAIENSVLELEQRHAQFQGVLDGLNKNLRQIEKSNADALIKLQTITYREVEKHNGALWNRVEELIKEQTERFNTTIAANQSQNQEALFQLSQDLNRISRSEERKQAAAQEWLDSNICFYNFISENYACEFFLPGQMERVSWQIDMASQNIQNGSYEAALSSLQQIHFVLSDLRIQLEKQHHAWQMLYIDTWETTMQILSQAEASTDIEAIDLHGEFLPYTIHVDAWVENRLSLLIERIHHFRSILENQVSSLSMETLREYRDQTIPEFQQELEDLVARARVNAINAQLRVNIADFVIQALKEQGFAPKGAGYQNADAQSAYEVNFSNYEGSEVIVQVKPTGALVGENELHLESLDQQRRSEDELENRWFHISQSLEQFGLTVGPYVREDRGVYQTPNQRPQSKGRGTQRSIRGGRTVTTHGN